MDFLYGMGDSVSQAEREQSEQVQGWVGCTE